MTRRRSFDFVKRGLDIVAAAAGIVVLSPVIAATAIAVRVKLGGPVLFRQQRAGRDGRHFTLVKFRSMLDSADAQGRLLDDEARLTPFGVALRSTSLDELPSLWNVLKGDMSVVGPRPLLVQYLGAYTPEQARRHEVRPGITGLAQVSGRNALEWEDIFAIDVEYVDGRSFGLDARILWRTVATVLGRDGISAEGHATREAFVDFDPPAANA
ncbi:sugar transferase [Gulosibacter faecalis]|jgi:lipopolysaccharide/colanic/teichoic acid biosynthesis glycosyltransferase|uniref:Sugar transferase n=1 Tax=Gulosibacter faecalis TaxID=272240 RepID=A0ABW5UUD3_9MICO|nr:sugar transferase [Gulosibacter faecalis]